MPIPTRTMMLGFAIACLVACAGAAPRGAANPDSDADGVTAADRCPAAAEDVDGFTDEDGCPDRDDDADGVVDLDDACPHAPEDVDGFQDGDGCPEADDDGDRIHDADDRCPCVPETFNGHEDEDGCPDCGPVLLVDDRIRILDRIYFARGSTTVDGQGDAILDAVARTIVANEVLVRVEVSGHASSDEPRAQALSEARADAVVSVLVERGVARERLVAAGYGADRPFESGTTRQAREANRRVEFAILESTQPEPRPCTLPPPVEGCTRGAEGG